MGLWSHRSQDREGKGERRFSRVPVVAFIEVTWSRPPGRERRQLYATSSGNQKHTSLVFSWGNLVTSRKDSPANALCNLDEYIEVFTTEQ